MPGRSFIGVGVLIGLIAGASIGTNFGNLAICLVLGVVVGGLGGWGVDRLSSKRN